MNNKRSTRVVKKIISLLIALVLVGGVYLKDTSIEVNAAELQHNTYAKANIRYRGHLNECSEKVYRFSLDRARKVKFTLNINGRRVNLDNYCIYNSSGKLIANEYIEDNGVSLSNTTNFTHYLPKGTYYFVINAGFSSGGNYYWEYSTQALSRITQGEHSTYAKAPLMSLGKDYFDHMGINTKKNVIKFNITKPGYYQWYTTVSGVNMTEMVIYNSAGKTISQDWIEHNGNPSGVTAVSKRMKLTKGTYYIVYESFFDLSSICASGILKFRVKPY